ncbi:MAG TPA: arginine--tRNA ligase [Candidatus Dojkabacteria bacterium]|nr:arginine--tRNA ligase [Candidatus Dojkabacteria bacterium]
MKQKIQKIVADALEMMDVDTSSLDVVVEVPKDSSNGDYSTNVAMRLASVLKKKPLDIANEIVSHIEDDDFSKVEAVVPGFINFYLSPTYLLKEVQRIADNPAGYFQSTLKQGEKLAIEYTDANPFKVLHIGHLYSNTVGEAFARLQEALGADVKRVNYQGDIGLHVAKTLWGLEKKLKDEEKTFSDVEKLPLAERVKYLGDAYVEGAEKYDYSDDEVVKKEIDEINYYIFYITNPVLEKKDFKRFEDVGMKEKYVKGRQWCLEHFETIYERLGTRFDHYFLESEVGATGLKIVLENVGKIFKEDDGAIIYEGDKEKNLHTRVFVNRYGLPTYEAKELGLAFKKKEDVDYDTSIIITANEQSGYFKVVMDALSKLDIDIAKNTKHFAHGVVKLPNAQKMSSRKGGVISAEWLLDETKKKVLKKMKESSTVPVENVEEVSEKIAIGAIKYAFLRVTVGSDIAFDFDKAISFDGDTGPYIQYVYSRCSSLLREFGNEGVSETHLERCSSNPYVENLTRQLSKGRGALLGSVLTYSPLTLCQYLFELSQSFNSFYQNVRLSDMEEEERSILLAIVRAVMNTVEYGLNLLGIEVVEKM